MSESLVDVNERSFICGITGSGKTTYATELYKKLETVCIFVNTNDEVLPENASQVKVFNIEQVVEALNQKYTKICFSPPPNKEITNKDIRDISIILTNMGRKINRQRKKPLIWCHLFVDEVQEFSSVTKKDTKIDSIWKRGRRYGIIGIAISQRPADVSHTILTQCRTHIIFKVSPYEVPYFTKYHIPIDEHKEWIEQEYHFIVFDGYSVKRAYPITPD